MNPVSCPNCALGWYISDDMPPAITCPRCLASLKNPYATSPKKKHPPIDPMRPVERQVQLDVRSGNVGVVIAIAMVAVGLPSLFWVSGGAYAGLVVPLGLVATIATCVGFAIAGWKSSPRASRDLAAIPRAPAPRPGRPDTYSAYGARQPDKARGAEHFGQVVGGIILGLAAGPVLGPVAPAVLVVGLVLLFVPRMRGLGLGLLLALPVAFLLLLGFCALYLAGAQLGG